MFTTNSFSPLRRAFDRVITLGLFAYCGAVVVHALTLTGF